MRIKRIYPIFLMLIFSFSIENLLACYCDFEPEFKSKKDLSEYGFIALVEVLKVDSIAGDKNNHRIEFRIIEKFKGDQIHQSVVWGKHRSLNQGWTSCDLGEDVGEEWFLFAKKVGNDYKIGSCDRTTRYKKANSFRFWPEPGEMDLFNKLRVVFGKRLTALKFQDGFRVEYLKNGQKQLEEFYRNGKLEGERKLWHVDGNLMLLQNWKNGLKDGYEYFWSERSGFSSKSKHRKGVQIDTASFWSGTDTSKFILKMDSRLYSISEDSARKIRSEKRLTRQTIYDGKSRLLSSKAYDDRLGFLEEEKKCNPKRGFCTTTYFHANGKIKAIGYSKNDIQIGVYKEWDENGEQVKYWEYDKQGRQVRESIKISDKLLPRM